MESNEYTKLVHLASIVERSVNDESADEARKKQSAPPPTYPAKRQAIGSSSGAAMKRNYPQSNSSSRPICTTCGKSTLVSAKLQLGAVFSVAKLGTCQ
jgi:hypothetical protein